ncbi:hypothetical protein FACS1894158_10250 [Betaproteobacteria bacterium]|nr:hypothetical protein FACS1894158_10250 [Betaproteobacteria bacterium]
MSAYGVTINAQSGEYVGFHHFALGGDAESRIKLVCDLARPAGVWNKQPFFCIGE